MAKHSVSIDLPEEIYNRYKERAVQMQRSVEAELAESLLRSAPTNPELSAELEEQLSQLAFLDNTALKRLAKSRLSKKESRRIESLHSKRQFEGLSEAETGELTDLMRRMNQWFVLRNEALDVLFKRGEDITEFISKK